MNIEHSQPFSGERLTQGGQPSAAEAEPGSRSMRSEQTAATVRRGMTDARALGWLSLGLGIAAVLVPRPLAALTGVGRSTAWLRLIGCRELASGAGLLTQRRSAPWLWSRVGGDIMDMLFVASALRRDNPNRARTLKTLGVLAAIGGADLAASLRASREKVRAVPSISFSEALIVGKTPEECYRFWRDTDNLPKFTWALESVTALGERRSRWVMRGPWRTRLEWTSELIEDEPGSHIAWRSIESAQIHHGGMVRFDAAPGNRGTLVRVSMYYRPVAGTAALQAAKLIDGWPRFAVREDLRRFKQLIETGEIATTRGQPSGRRSPLGRAISAARRSAERSLS